MTVSAPVSPASPQTLFCQDSSTTELLISKLTELTALPQTLSPPRVRAVRVGKSKLGTPTSCDSQRLDIVRASRRLSLCLSLSCCISSKGQLGVTQAPAEGGFLLACAASILLV